MGKRITQQARGKGSLTFRVKRKAYRYRIGYPPLSVTGTGVITGLFNSSAHSTPLAKVIINGKSFISPAADGVYEGQKIEINGKIGNGNIVRLRDAPQGTRVFNIESVPGNGGKFMRSSGCSAVVSSKDGNGVEIQIGRRKIRLSEDCRVTVGTAAGEGRLTKPIIKAGKMHHMMKSKGRKWHRSSAVKVNAVDHPFGGGRGKRIKSKIAKRNSAPGQKVGHIRPRRTGKSK
jgi:large subunit ribosomal protein L2